MLCRVLCRAELLADRHSREYLSKVWDTEKDDFAVRDDVWIWMDRSDQDLTAENASYGPLTVGYGERDCKLCRRHTAEALCSQLSAGFRSGRA